MLLTQLSTKTSSLSCYYHIVQVINDVSFIKSLTDFSSSLLPMFKAACNFAVTSTVRIPNDQDKLITPKRCSQSRNRHHRRISPHVIRQETRHMLSSNASSQNGRPDLNPVHAAFNAAANDTGEAVEAVNNGQRQAVVEGTEYQSGQG